MATLTFCVMTATDVPAYMKALTEMNTFKRRTTPVSYCFQKSTEEVIWVEISSPEVCDSNIMTMMEGGMATAVANMRKQLTKGELCVLGATDLYKSVYITPDTVDDVMVKRDLIDGAPGKVTARCKGTATYYMRVMEIKTKPGKMADFVACTQKLLALTMETEHTCQLVPFSEDCCYFVEINKPEHWEMVSQRFKEDAAFLEGAAASNECVEEVKYFCYGAAPNNVCPLLPAGTPFLTSDTFTGWF